MTCNPKPDCQSLLRDNLGGKIRLNIPGKLLLISLFLYCLRNREMICTVFQCKCMTSSDFVISHKKTKDEKLLDLQTTRRDR